MEKPDSGCLSVTQAIMGDLHWKIVFSQKNFSENGLYLYCYGD